MNMDIFKKLRQTSITALAVIFLLAPLTACRDRNAEKETAASAVTMKFKNGPAEVTIRVDRDNISTVDRLNLEIEAVTDNGYETEFPSFPDGLGEFTVVDYHTLQPELVESNQVKTSRSYALDPLLSGNYTIPSFTVKFREKNTDNPKEYEIETEEIKITVKSIFTEETDKSDIHDIIGPINLPRRMGILLGVLGGIIVLLSLVFLGAFLLKRNRGNAEDIKTVRSPHEIALDELLQLVHEDLPGKGKIKLFYQRISDILRRYIEGRFAIRAPEQTTEEFLENLKKSGTLNRKFRQPLEEFLSHCDLVKFAEHRPNMEEIRKIFEICETFIEKTKEEAAG